MRESRLTVDQLHQLTEEQHLREAEEKKMRTEQARRRNMEIKQRELEEVCVCVRVCVCTHVHTLHRASPKQSQLLQQNGKPVSRAGESDE